VTSSSKTDISISRNRDIAKNDDKNKLNDFRSESILNLTEQCPVESQKMQKIQSIDLKQLFDKLVKEARKLHEFINELLLKYSPKFILKGWNMVPKLEDEQCPLSNTTFENETCDVPLKPYDPTWVYNGNSLLYNVEYGLPIKIDIDFKNSNLSFRRFNPNTLKFDDESINVITVFDNNKKVYLEAPTKFIEGQLKCSKNETLIPGAYLVGPPVSQQCEKPKTEILVFLDENEIEFYKPMKSNKSFLSTKNDLSTINIPKLFDHEDCPISSIKKCSEPLRKKSIYNIFTKENKSFKRNYTEYS
jgi:hypothetical protein